MNCPKCKMNEYNESFTDSDMYICEHCGFREIKTEVIDRQQQEIEKLKTQSTQDSKDLDTLSKSIIAWSELHEQRGIRLQHKEAQITELGELNAHHEKLLDDERKAYWELKSRLEEAESLIFGITPTAMDGASVKILRACLSYKKKYQKDTDCLFGL